MRLAFDQRAVTAIEYAMIAAFLSVVIIAAVNALGQNVKTEFFDHIANAI